ncbi:MAG: hypothetical protein M3N50_13105 [Pseudomonadota bacterium]|nr:hypothetical protein [Pseudomonadota bacterium]
MMHAVDMTSDSAQTCSVIDFRRRSMVLQWHALAGTWSPHDIPPVLVHGVALIRAVQPNICVFGRGGRLWLQIGPNEFALSENSPRISCNRVAVSFGFRRRFTVESSSGGVLFSHAYWTDQHPDFFRWLAVAAADPQWRISCGRQWSEGVAPDSLRSD